MGLAKKGTSRITVEGIEYRWVVSGDDGFLELLVEHADGRGRRLCRQFDYEFGAITPRTVRETILAARAAGWDPERPGTQLDLR